MEIKVAIETIYVIVVGMFAGAKNIFGFLWLMQWCLNAHFSSEIKTNRNTIQCSHIWKYYHKHISIRDWEDKITIS